MICIYFENIIVINFEYVLFLYIKKYYSKILGFLNDNILVVN